MLSIEVSPLPVGPQGHILMIYTPLARGELPMLISRIMDIKCTRSTNHVINSEDLSSEEPKHGLLTVSSIILPVVGSEKKRCDLF
jgi:hypothetical protein